MLRRTLTETIITPATIGSESTDKYQPPHLFTFLYFYIHIHQRSRYQTIAVDGAYPLARLTIRPRLSQLAAGVRRAYSLWLFVSSHSLLQTSQILQHLDDTSTASTLSKSTTHKPPLQPPLSTLLYPSTNTSISPLPPSNPAPSSLRSSQIL
jgi:hypothetical protein